MENNIGSWLAKRPSSRGSGRHMSAPMASGSPATRLIFDDDFVDTAAPV